MAIRDIIARGIGFAPASIKFIVTHGLIPGAEPSIWTEIIPPNTAIWTTVPVAATTEIWTEVPTG